MDTPPDLEEQLAQTQRAADVLGRFLDSVRPAVEAAAEAVARSFQLTQEATEPPRRAPSLKAWTRFTAAPQAQPRARHRSGPGPRPLTQPRAVRRPLTRPRAARVRPPKST